MNGVAAQTPQMLALFGDAAGRERISKFRQRLLERGRIADGAPIPSSRLLPDHPGLGPMTRSEWERFHCVHCATT